MPSQVLDPPPVPIAATRPLRYFTPWLAVLTLVWAAIYAACFPDPVGLAARNWPLVAVGVVGAMLGNLTAIGGGIVFIPVLMFVYGLDPVSALKLALVTQAVGMTSGAAGWLQRRTVPLELLKWTIPSLLLGAAVSTFVFHPQPLVVKGLFGPISLVVGVLTLVTLDRHGTQDSVPAKAIFPLFCVSILGGIVTGWVAIGEGEIIAAFCMLACSLKADKAIGLGVVLLSVNSIALAAVHALYFGGVPWELAIFTILGVLWGGRLGPFLSQKVSARRLKAVFAWIALLDGLLIIAQVLRAE